MAPGDEILGDMDDLLRAEPAGNALPARLVAEKLRAIEPFGEHVALIVVDDQPRSDRQPEIAESLQIEVQVEDVELRSPARRHPRDEVGRGPLLPPPRQRRHP